MEIEIRGAERLSFRERQVVALKETGMSHRDVADRLGISEASVATLYGRAKKKGYEVVMILSGDPLGLYEPAEGDDPDESEVSSENEGDG